MKTKCKKILIIFALFLTVAVLSFAFVGCNSPNDNLSELNAAIALMQKSNDISLNMTMTIKVGKETQSLNLSLAKTGEGSARQAMVSMKSAGTAAAVYYKDGLAVFCQDNYVSDYKNITFDEFWGENSDIAGDAFFDIDGDFEVSRKSSGNKYIYTVKINDENFINEMLAGFGLSLPKNFKYKDMFSYKYTVDTVSGLLERFDYDYSLSIDGTDVSIKTGATYTISGVSISFPAYTTYYFTYYANGEPENIGGSESTYAPPAPAKENYTDTADGKVKYYDLGDYIDIAYDSKYGNLIVGRETAIDIFDKNMKLVKSFDYLLDVKALDCDNGVLAVGFGEARQFKTYELSNYSLLKTVALEYTVYELVIDGDIIITSDGDQWCYLNFYSISQDKTIYNRSSYYRPKLEINREKHIIYLCETGISSSDLYYINSQTGTVLYSSAFMEFGYNYSRTYYDGQYLHYYGKTFAGDKYKQVSKNGLTNEYTSTGGFSEYFTYLSSENTDLVFGTYNNAAYVNMYDNRSKSYIYKFPFYTDGAITIGNGRYLMTGGKGRYIAIVDLSGVNIPAFAGAPMRQPGQTPASPPAPAKENYTDTADGKVKYYDLGDYVDIAYDSRYGNFIVGRKTAVDIFDENMKLVKSFDYLLDVKALDCDNGILAVGLGKANQFRVYDLTDYSLVRTVNMRTTVFELVIDGDIIITANEDQHCSLFFYSISKGTIKEVSSFYQPKLELNRADHILYLGETALSSSALVYLNSQTGEILFKSPFSMFSYNYKRPYYDGRYLHYYGRSFIYDTGTIISRNGLVDFYNVSDGFSEYMTYFVSDSTDLIYGSYANAAYIGIYDKASGQYIYKFPFYASGVTDIGSNRYLLIGAAGKYIAIADLAGVNIPQYTGMPEKQHTADIAVTPDALTGSINTDKVYTKSAADDKYIYILDCNNKKLDIYDPITLAVVYTKTFDARPESVDAYGGLIVVGLGEAARFVLINRDNFSEETVTASEKVYSALIYNDSIIYAPVDQHCLLYKYDMIGKTHTVISPQSYFSHYYPTLDIDRSTGTLFIGERNSSSCDLTIYDIDNNTVIYQSPWSTNWYASKNVYFDGFFVHYNGRSFDLAGAAVSMSDATCAYNIMQHYTSVATIYNDGEISIFTGIQDGKTYTVIYDTVNDIALKKIAISGTSATKLGDAYFIFTNGGSSVHRIVVY